MTAFSVLCLPQQLTSKYEVILSQPPSPYTSQMKEREKLDLFISYPPNSLTYTRVSKGFLTSLWCCKFEFNLNLVWMNLLNRIFIVIEVDIERRSVRKFFFFFYRVRRQSIIHKGNEMNKITLLQNWPVAEFILMTRRNSLFWKTIMGHTGFLWTACILWVIFCVGLT